MSFVKLILDFQDLLKKEGTGSPTDIQDHASGFADTVDGYVSKLYDPAKRQVKSTIKSLMIPPIVAVGAAPGSGIVSVDSQKAALQYGLAISLYAAAIIIDPAPVNITLGGIVTPPGNVIVAQIVAPTISLSIQSDFSSIFSEDSPEGLPLDLLILNKANKFADAIKKAFTTATVVTISGLDSTLPPPAGIGPQPFLITGPLSET